MAGAGASPGFVDYFARETVVCPLATSLREMCSRVDSLITPNMNTKPSPFGSGFLGLEVPTLSSSRFFATALLGLLCLVLPSASALAAQAGQKPDGKPAPGRVVVNRTVPRVEPPDTTLRLSAEPKTHEIASARVFSEPLVSTGGEPDAAENQAIGRVLLRHARHIDADDVMHLTEFLAAHPRGKWSASVLYNLGIDYFHSGYWSKALDVLEKAWSLSQDATEPKAKALADRAGGELAMLYARLGYVSQLDALLQSFEGRTVVGSATERISGARQGLWSMQHMPWIAFRCGPLALDRIRAAKDPNLVANKYVQDSHATTNGYSLTQLLQLARDLGMFWQMGFRRPSAEFAMPCVVHFKLNHYAALIRRDGDRYLIQDPTFGPDLWVSAKALEEETSGYFLVPSGALPAGWRTVSDAEGARIWGKGQTSNNNPDDTSPDDKKKDDPQSCPAGGGMAAANAHLMVVSLNIVDTPVGYRPPVGPAVRFTVTYNQREANQPATFSYANLGAKWTFNWMAYVTDNPLAPAANVTYYALGGGKRIFSGFNPDTQTYAMPLRGQSLLRRTSTNSYEMLQADGSKLVFGQPDGSAGTSRKVFLTRLTDPAGNAVDLTYDANFRLVAIRDAIGQVTTLAYERAGDIYKITKVTDPFGRYATFEYDASGRLFKITDVISLLSQFTYEGSSDFIQALITPYGTNRFSKGESGRTRWLEMTDAMGDTERVEYAERTDVGVPGSEPASVLPQGMFLRNWVMYARNTYYWNKRAYIEARNDYTKARIYHWLHTADYSSATGILESEKQALENRVWYNYDGQPQNNEGATVPGNSDKPSKIGRLLDDGSTQLYQYKYNAFGYITNTVDPVGRRMSYVYDTNGIDLLEVRQTTGGQNELVAKYLYNSLHLPISIQDSAGQITTNTFNARGQLLTTTNPRLDNTTLRYDTNGVLLSIDGALSGTNDTVSFTYDDFGRVKTFTDTDGYMLAYAYDNLDRPTNSTYPDGTFEALSFDKLDRVAIRDRLGRESRRSYNAIRQIAAAVDALFRTNRLEWCECGSLTAIVDGLGRATRWQYDVQGRVQEKQYADGSKVAITYENTTSRPKYIRDEMGQFKVFDYYADDRVRLVSYASAQVPTPAVTFIWDTNYARLRNMQDGHGVTLYDYHPVGSLGAGQLATVNGPRSNDVIAYQYDVLGRERSRSINGVSQTLAFDGLGRVTNVVNALGSFTNTYDGATKRVVDVSFPNGQRTHRDYFDNVGDRRLRELRHAKLDGSLLARFAHTYNSVGQIMTWTQEVTGQTQVWTNAYDLADQLRSVVVTEGASIVETYAYDYDVAGNRLSESINGVSRSFSYNALNELAASAGGSNGPAAYEWDAEHRLTALNQGSHRTEFTYDGFGRRVQVTEREGGTLVSQRSFLWSGTELCEERDAGGGVVLKRFFEAGFQDVAGAGSTNLFASRDHLASVRLLNDQAGVVISRVKYSPFGAQTLTGALEPSFAFGGYYRHVPSGLLLTLYRAFDASQGRWLSRDPLMESAGFNLFAYADNNPVNKMDPLGLFTEGGCTKLPWDPNDPESQKKWIEEKLKEWAKEKGEEAWEACKEHPWTCASIAASLAAVALSSEYPKEGKDLEVPFKFGNVDITIGGKPGGSGWDAITTPPTDVKIGIGWKWKF